LSKLSFGICSVATNQYINYWEQMVISSKSNHGQFGLHFHVFTDQIDRVNSFARDNPDLGITCHKIDSLKWPEATLYRYKLISEEAESLTEDYLMHLDADMLFKEEFGRDLRPLDWENGIALVAHPGFWRPAGFGRVRFYLSNPKIFLIDLVSYLKVGGLGSWSQDLSSLAYVERHNRREYVCGGVWMGSRLSFLDMVSSLHNSVSNDEERGVMAIWHDESHLNKWASKNLHTTLTPRYCFDPGYPQLRNLEEVIRAVDKNLEI
jgi:hypothetical protein